MLYYIYKITNKINGKYYIGRHSTNNIEDGYMGSGIGIVNAIKKYGIDNFTKEILQFANNTEELWELEKTIVNDIVVKDEMSYNMAYGGKHYLHGLKENNIDAFILHQSEAGKKGAESFLSKMNEEDKKNWHKKGGVAAHISRKKSGYLFNHNKGKKYNMKKRECTSCGKIGCGPNMTRYHFENCKLKSN
jgi:hypothetical protein